jgi:hypothetical protein
MRMGLGEGGRFQAILFTREERNIREASFCRRNTIVVNRRDRRGERPVYMLGNGRITVDNIHMKIPRRGIVFFY